MIDQIKEISTKLPVLESVSSIYRIINSIRIAAGEQGIDRYTNE